MVVALSSILYTHSVLLGRGWGIRNDNHFIPKKLALEPEGQWGKGVPSASQKDLQEYLPI